MSATRSFATDGVGGMLDLQFASDSDDGSFDWGDAEVVTVDDAPYQAAFDTDTFYRIPLTAARPVDQTYVFDNDGEQVAVEMRKPAEELRQAAWSLDNAPLTLGHPPNDICDSVEYVHGFVRDPGYDTDGDSLDAHGYVPVTDDEAKAHIDRNDGTSIGFFYNTDTDAEGVDAYQRDLLIDHLAVVDKGRCSREDGCGLAVDSLSDAQGTAIRGFDDIGDDGCSDGPCQCGKHVGDTQTAVDSHYGRGDHVSWPWGNGTGYGRVTSMATSGTLSVSTPNGQATREATEDEPAYRIKVWRQSDTEYRGYAVKSHSELNDWSGPNGNTASDSLDTILHDTIGIDVDVDGTSIDLTPPESVQSNAQTVLDWRDDDDKTVEGMTDTGWDRAEQLASGEELTVDDIVGGSDGMAVWWSRHEQYNVRSTDDGWAYKRADDTPKHKDNSYVAALGWGGIPGMKWAFARGNEINEAQGDDTRYGADSVVPTGVETMYRTDQSVAGTIVFEGTRKGDLDESAIPNDDYEMHYVFDADTKSDSSFPLVDADGYLRRENVQAAASYSSDAPDESMLWDVLEAVNGKFDEPPLDDETVMEHTSSGTDATTNLDIPTMGDDFNLSDLDTDAVADRHDGVAEVLEQKNELNEQLDAAKDRISELEEEVQSYRADEKQELVDDILAFTDRWDEDELLEMKVDRLEDRLEFAEDVAATVDSPSGDGGVETDADDNGGDDQGSQYEAGETYDMADTATGM